MKGSLQKLLGGYREFRDKYAHDDQSIMRSLSDNGQQPEVMIIACCDSRVDPALILQCDPGDLFVVRNVANIVPPYEKDEMHHGTSAALEFGICYLNVKHLILLGHSQCGGIQALLYGSTATQNDFISNWVSLAKTADNAEQDPNEYSKLALNQSYRHCLTFPWIKEKVDSQELHIHRWYFDIKHGQIFTYSPSKKAYQPLEFNAQF